jgi:hypothetical protein
MEPQKASHVLGHSFRRLTLRSATGKSQRDFHHLNNRRIEGKKFCNSFSFWRTLKSK